MIPTKEQFSELNSALNKSVEFICNHLGDTHSLKESPELPAIELPEMEDSVFLKLITDKELQEPVRLMLQERIYPDVELYIEQSEAIQQLPAWNWLHSQQNFIRSKGKIFKHWPSEEQPGNDLAKFIIKVTFDRFVSRIKERELLISRGVTSDIKNAKTIEERIAARLVDSSRHQLFHSALGSAARCAVRYRTWVAGVAFALSNYHYGETAEMAVNRKNKVGALIAAWETFSEQIALVQSDTEIREYLRPSVGRICTNRELVMLRALHQDGALYFIGRKDETVSERLFIKEIALLNRKHFGKPQTSVIADLFYLDGMKSAPTERAIQRIAKSAIANRLEIGNVERNAIELWRQQK